MSEGPLPTLLENTEQGDHDISKMCDHEVRGKSMKTALFCISFLRKGGALAFVGRIHNLKDLKDQWRGAGR